MTPKPRHQGVGGPEPKPPHPISLGERVLFHGAPVRPAAVAWEHRSLETSKGRPIQRRATPERSPTRVVGPRRARKPRLGAPLAPPPPPFLGHLTDDPKDMGGPGGGDWENRRPPILGGASRPPPVGWVARSIVTPIHERRPETRARFGPFEDFPFPWPSPRGERG